MQCTNVFCYGTLMAPEVVQTLIGRFQPVLTSVESVPILCKLDGFRRHPVIAGVFPAIIPNTDSCVEGILLQQVSQREMRILDWFEDEDYDRRLVSVQTTTDNIRYEAHAYVWKASLHKLDLSTDWSHADFLQEHLDWYLQSTVRPCKRELNRLGY